MQMLSLRNLSSDSLVTLSLLDLFMSELAPFHHLMLKETVLTDTLIFPQFLSKKRPAISSFIMVCHSSIVSYPFPAIFETTHCFQQYNTFQLKLTRVWFQHCCSKDREGWKKSSKSWNTCRSDLVDLGCTQTALNCKSISCFLETAFLCYCGFYFIFCDLFLKTSGS